MTRQLFKIIIRRSGCLGVGLVLLLSVGLQPVFVLAATDPAASTAPSAATTAPDPTPSAPAPDPSTPPPAPPCVPPAATSAGIQQPTGSDASTYHYNCDSGLWENDYYTWSAATHQATPKTPLVYTCNPATSQWDSSQWVWSAAAKQYQSRSFSVAAPPAGANTVPCPPPAPATAVAADTSNNTNNDGSSNTSAGSSDITNTNTLGIGNTITASTLTGDATVAGNTFGGNAMSGTAQTIANVMNLLQSTSSLAGPNATTFVANINDDVQGNLIIDPSLLQPAASQTGLVNNTQINDVTNGQIDNNIALQSQSGNATVAGNTEASDATSGSANAVANVVNMINSAVSSGQSFLGVVNIFGNLTGNILVPQQLLDSLLASNAPSATLDTSNITNSSVLDQFNNQAINNNVTATAQTGNATVTGNTKAGGATSGNANTNVTIFNLTGQQVVGSNSMLVFVNVLGKWVGLIMNAPVGSTAAELGGDITQDSTSANTDANTSNNETINNNINVGAQSGNANVRDNTVAGNATSGNANAGVNLLNVTNSQLSLSNWFGILFINVFGTWTGNFGTYDKSAPPPQPVLLPESSSTTNGAANTPPGATSANDPVHAFRFVPKGGKNFKLVSTTVPDTKVLGAATTHTSGGKHTGSLNGKPVASTSFTLLPILGGLFCLALIGGNEVRVTRRKHRATARVSLNLS